MADERSIQIGGYTAHRAAMDLLERIAELEKVTLYPGPESEGRPATRSWLLRTYASCVKATDGIAPNENQLESEPWLKRGPS